MNGFSKAMGGSCDDTEASFGCVPDAYRVGQFAGELSVALFDEAEEVPDQSF